MKGSTRRIARFALRGLAIYGAWYVLYDLWLLPDGRLDEWLSTTVASMSTAILNVVGIEALVEGRVLGFAGGPAVEVADGCNGLTTIGLFIGFVLAFPGTWLRRAVFIPLGLAVIFLSNILRVSVLLLFLRYWPPGFELVHGLGAPTFFYLIVFGLWMVWANYSMSPSAPEPNVTADSPSTTAPASA